MTDLFGQIDDITCWHVSQVSKWAIINGTMCEDILSWVKLWYHVCRYSIMSVVMVPCVQIFNHAWKNVNNMASMGVWISFFSFLFWANRVWRRLDMPISFNMSHYMWIYLKKCQKYSQKTESVWVWIDKVGGLVFFSPSEILENWVWRRLYLTISFKMSHHMSSYLQKWQSY